MATDWDAVTANHKERGKRVQAIVDLLERFEISEQRVWEDHAILRGTYYDELILAIERLTSESLADILVSMARDAQDAWDSGYTYGSYQYHDTAVAELKADIAARHFKQWKSGISEAQS
jgi:hypothetical protein